MNIISKPEDLEKQITSCKDCVFAKYKDDTQIGCELDLLQYYEDYLVPAKDDDKEFELINGRYCYYQRTPNWIDNLKEAGLEKVNLIDQVKKENKISYNLIVLSDYNHSDLIEYVEKVNKLSFRPYRLSILHQGIANPNLGKRLNKVSKLKEWKLFNIVPGAPMYQIINDALKSTKLPFYLIADLKEDISDNFLKEINDMIFVHNRSFFIIKKNAKVFASKMVSNHYNGYSFGTSLEEKIIADNEESRIITI